MKYYISKEEYQRYIIDKNRPSPPNSVVIADDGDGYELQPGWYLDRETQIGGIRRVYDWHIEGYFLRIEEFHDVRDFYCIVGRGIQNEHKRDHIMKRFPKGGCIMSNGFVLVDNMDKKLKIHEALRTKDTNQHEPFGVPSGTIVATDLPSSEDNGVIECFFGYLECGKYNTHTSCAGKGFSITYDGNTKTKVTSHVVESWGSLSVPNIERRYLENFIQEHNPKMW